MRNALFPMLLAATVLLAGCPKRDAVQDMPEDAQDGSGADATGSRDGGLEQGRAIDGQSALSPEMQAALGERIVYFDYDSNELRPQYTTLITAHARNLVSNPRLRLRLEGHTDERGSREYNIGLGERRAQAVRRALMLQGAGEDQIATVSYGEERAAVSGSDESAWSQNRRVELVYAN